MFESMPRTRGAFFAHGLRTCTSRRFPAQTGCDAERHFWSLRDQKTVPNL